LNMSVLTKEPMARVVHELAPHLLLLKQKLNN
jgi:hypothetical protein